MIVEAGYDLHTLLVGGRFRPGSLRVVSLDADFRVIAVTEVVDDFSGSLESVSLERLDAAIPRHDDDDEFAARYAVRFAALGFEVSKVDGYLEGLDWGELARIEDWLDCRGIELLGVQVFDPEWWASTGPAKTFSTYGDSENYPRMLVIRGPHPFLSCECAVCGPERERWRRAREERATDEQEV